MQFVKLFNTMQLIREIYTALDNKHFSFPEMCKHYSLFYQKVIFCYYNTVHGPRADKYFR